MSCKYLTLRSNFERHLANGIKFCGILIQQANDPVENDKDPNKDREAPIKKKIYCLNFPLLFLNPVAIIILYFVFPILQNLQHSVQGHNQEGVAHHEDHPDVNHLDIGSHWQRLDHSNETERNLKIRCNAKNPSRIYIREGMLQIGMLKQIVYIKYGHQICIKCKQIQIGKNSLKD